MMELPVARVWTGKLSPVKNSRAEKGPMRKNRPALYNPMMSGKFPFGAWSMMKKETAHRIQPFPIALRRPIRSPSQPWNR